MRDRTDINDAVHGWGGVVLHDIINNTHARKAVERGAAAWRILCRPGQAGHGGAGRGLSDGSACAGNEVRIVKSALAVGQL